MAAARSAARKGEGKAGGDLERKSAGPGAAAGGGGDDDAAGDGKVYSVAPGRGPGPGGHRAASAGRKGRRHRGLPLAQSARRMKRARGEQERAALVAQLEEREQQIEVQKMEIRRLRDKVYALLQEPMVSGGGGGGGAGGGMGGGSLQLGGSVNSVGALEANLRARLSSTAGAAPAGVGLLGGPAPDPAPLGRSYPSFGGGGGGGTNPNSGTRGKGLGVVGQHTGGRGLGGSKSTPYLGVQGPGDALRPSTSQASFRRRKM